ncbi:MAG: GlxA family transcriptional regulator [Alphaproteobacteria bacterium]|nr:GlxA family transcriptional regulator [Alphaproteobacteria bacterium]
MARARSSDDAIGTIGADHGQTEQVGFLLVDQFSMLAFASAVEPLRSANRMSGRRLYDWRIFSPDGGPVRASNGIPVVPDTAVTAVDRLPTLYVVAGIDGHGFEDKRTFACLRRLARRGCRMGAICTGSHVLAKAGLLDGYRATIHWEDLPAFAEAHPDVTVTHDIFEIDRNRLTCSGGTAGLDMMLHVIAVSHGQALAAQISDQFIHQQIRTPESGQRPTVQSRLGVSDPKLIAAVAAMESHLESPLPMAVIAKRAGLSTRQLERAFRRQFGRGPLRYYHELRLNQARLLLMQGENSVLSVAMATGFTSASHFSRRYRAYFNRSPREERAR